MSILCRRCNTDFSFELLSYFTNYSQIRSHRERICHPSTSVNVSVNYSGPAVPRKLRHGEIVHPSSVNVSVNYPDPAIPHKLRRGNFPPFLQRHCKCKLPGPAVPRKLRQGYFPGRM